MMVTCEYDLDRELRSCRAPRLASALVPEDWDGPRRRPRRMRHALCRPGRVGTAAAVLTVLVVMLLTGIARPGEPAQAQPGEVEPVPAMDRLRSAAAHQPDRTVPR